MDFNSTIDLIVKDLDEARQIIDDLKRYPGVPVLQVELAKSKCKSAGEVISLLKSIQDTAPALKEEHVTQQQPPVEEKIKPSGPVEAAPVPEERKEEKEEKEEKQKEEYKKEHKEPEIIIRETVMPPAEKKSEPKKSVKKVTEPEIIADKFNTLPGSFNEQIGSMINDSDLSNIINTKPLSSITDAIGVNDRFMYIREVFNNNKDAYTQAISKLDMADNLSDAKAMILSYTGDSDNEAANQLLNLVKRKLHSNG